MPFSPGPEGDSPRDIWISFLIGPAIALLLFGPGIVAYLLR